MTTWSPGHHTPGSIHARGEYVTAPNLNATQLIDELRRRHARIVVRGNRVSIYPTDRDATPVVCSLRNLDLSNASGSHRVRILGQLKRAGFDLTEETEVKPTPAPVSPQRPTLVAPVGRADPQVDQLLELIGELEGRLGAQEAANVDLVERVGRLERAKDTHRAELDIHLGAIERLEARPAAGRGPSRAEILRKLVLEYLQTIPGVPQTPVVIEGVLAAAGTLPADTGRTQVAGACIELAKQRRLEAGGKEGPFRGTYRFPLPKEGK